MTAPTIPPSTEREATSRRARTDGVRLAGRVRERLARLPTRLRGDGRRPVWLVAPLAAGWAAIIGLGIAALPAVVVWMTTPQSGLTWLESLRVSGLLWLVADGAPISLAGTVYSLLPWGLAIVPVLLLGYAGGWASRRSRVDTLGGVALLVGLGTVTYALVAAGLAAWTHGPVDGVSPLDAFVMAGLLAAVAFGWGAIRSADVDVVARVPDWAVVIVRSGLVGVLAILGLGAFAATAALLVHVDDAVTMAQSLHAGLGGGLGLLVAGIAYVPVMVVWAASYVVGAGVVIGPAVTVSPFIPVTAPTQLPPFPMLAALPQTASPLAWALPLAGILAGVLVGLAVARHARHESRLLRLALAVGAAAVSALVMLLLAALASGSLGDLRLAHVGPSPTTVAVLTGLLVLLGAVPSAVAVPSTDRPALSILAAGSRADEYGDTDDDPRVDPDAADPRDAE